MDILRDVEADPTLLVARRYSDQADAYRTHWAPVLRALGTELLEGSSLGGARAILDIGTGVGTLLPEIRIRAPEALVVGADIAERMLRLAPSAFPRVVANAAALPFADGSFDALVMAFMLFHVPDPARAVTEARRVLRPAGSAATATWRSDEEESPAQRTWTKLLDSFDAPADEGLLARHDLMDSEQKVARLLETAGFEIVAQRERVSVDRLDLEAFLARKTSFGSDHRRFRSLDPSKQAALLRAGREALEPLGPDDFTSRQTAILTWARRPG